MNNLIIASAEKHLVLYRDMVSAISSCSRIDECKDIADKSIALAAYYKQIKDDATVQQFNEIRLRAWRRIGELFASVDVSTCETQTAKVKKIRESFDHAVIGQITESRVWEILKLMEVSDRDFEHAMKDRDLSGSIPDLIRRTPQHKEMVRRNLKASRPKPKSAAEILRAREREEQRREQEEKQAIDQARTNRHLNELVESSNVTMRELGITLAKKEQSGLKQIVVLLEPKVYADLKLIASREKATIQKIIRHGIGTVLREHGYATGGKVQ